MANELVSLVAELRTQTGTSHSRRLRTEGRVPAVVYGLSEEPVSLTLAGDVITPIVVSGNQVVDLSFGDTTTKAMIRDVQWDTFLTHIVHVDLLRVDDNARIDLELFIEIRGTVNEGVLQQLERSLMVNCPVFLIPESPVVRVGSLKIGDTVTVGDLEFPDGVTVNAPADTVVVRVEEAQEVEFDTEADEGGALEPELIGRSADGEGDGEGGDE